MNELGWDVHSFDHEDANSQFEFDFSYTDALAMADRFVLWRLMTKLVARRHGCRRRSCRSPTATGPATAATSTCRSPTLATGANLFEPVDDPRGAGVSALAYKFIAGVLAHAPAICAVACPTVNSYKRLVKSGSMTGFTWAPVFISYGRNNRTHMLRIPTRLAARRVARGRHLVQPVPRARRCSSPPASRGSSTGSTRATRSRSTCTSRATTQLAELGVSTLPRTLLEAVEALDARPARRARCSGRSCKASFVELKTREWWEYHNTVSQWEHDRYLDFF